MVARINDLKRMLGVTEGYSRHLSIPEIPSPGGTKAFALGTSCYKAVRGCFQGPQLGSQKLTMPGH